MAQQKQEEKWYFVLFQPNANPTNVFSLSDLSSGSQRLLGIVASLIYDHSAVMLLEHPEDGIHRALLRKLIGLLETYSDPQSTHYLKPLSGRFQHCYS